MSKQSEPPGKRTYGAAALHSAAVAALLFGLLPAVTATGVSSAQSNCTTFPETGKTVCGKFNDYWRGHGGLPQQGYPISGEIQEKSETDGKTYTVQYFERAVFESHPENAAPNDVLLSLLGNFLYKQKYPNGAPGQRASTDNAVTFTQTGHSLGGKFRTYWETHGGLAQQGYPISDEFQERSDLDGKTYTVQYFERAVFESHPENKPPYDVLLSQLGTFRYKTRYEQANGGQGGQPGQATPAPTSAPTAAPSRNAGTLQQLDNMNSERGCHTAALLSSGKVLLVGGGLTSKQEWNSSAELYDPATRKFTPTGSMSEERACPESVVLQNGKVLVIGGSLGDGGRSAELYDPATGTFSRTGDLVQGRDGEPFAATLLKDGRVLVTGGISTTLMNEAEIYDPATGTFSRTGDMNDGRGNHTSTLLNDGRVLVVGGRNASPDITPVAVLASAELYDPSTGKFTRTGSLAAARYKHGAALLNDGRVLIVGGSDTRQQAGGLIAGAEIYDPSTGQFSPGGNMIQPRYKIIHAAVTLTDGRVFVGGGSNPEVYDPSTKSFAAVSGQLGAQNCFQTATRLLDGSVLLAGGDSSSTSMATARAWLYQP